MDQNIFDNVKEPMFTAKQAKRIAKAVKRGKHKRLKEERTK